MNLNEFLSDIVFQVQTSNFKLQSIWKPETLNPTRFIKNHWVWTLICMMSKGCWSLYNQINSHIGVKQGLHNFTQLTCTCPSMLVSVITIPPLSRVCKHKGSAGIHGSLHEFSEILGFPKIWEPNPKIWDLGINLVFFISEVDAELPFALRKINFKRVGVCSSVAWPRKTCVLQLSQNLGIPKISESKF